MTKTYIGIQLHGVCISNDDGDSQECFEENEHPQFYGVYFRHKDGTLAWNSDHAVYEEALKHAWLLAHSLGVDVIDRVAITRNRKATGQCVSPRQKWVALCGKQGWGASSQIIHLVGFLEDTGLMSKFVAYARAAAAEEDADTVQQ